MGLTLQHLMTYQRTAQAKPGNRWVPISGETAMTAMGYACYGVDMQGKSSTTTRWMKLNES